MTPREQAFHQRCITLALREAERAQAAGEVPTGCVIIRHDPEAWERESETHPVIHIVARAHNQTETLKDPTAHAEILAITQAAAAVGDWRLTGCALYVTKEPCAMCAGAIILARLPLVAWGLSDPARGGHSHFGILADPALNHRPRLCPGILQDQCRAAFQAFFQTRRLENTPTGEATP